MRKKIVAVCALAMLAVSVPLCWYAYKPILSRLYVRQLARAEDHNFEACIDRVAGVGESAVPYLVDLLQREGPVATRAGLALTKILDAIPADDSRHAETATLVWSAYAVASTDGRQVVLRLLESSIVGQTNLEIPRGVVHTALKDESPTVRELAVILAVRPEISLDPEVVSLLRDPVASVRRSAILAVGSARDLVPDDELLPWLHDDDAQVRELCEAALRARGLEHADITLGRLVTHPDPLKRLEVIDKLPTNTQLDAYAWLHKLSQDTAPVVRAGAAQAALDPEYRFGVDFAPRLKQMEEADPDGTVRQIAGDLLRRHQRRAHENTPR